MAGGKGHGSTAGASSLPSCCAPTRAALVIPRAQLAGPRRSQHKAPTKLLNPRAGASAPPSNPPREHPQAATPGLEGGPEAAGVPSSRPQPRREPHGTPPLWRAEKQRQMAMQVQKKKRTKG